VLASNRNPPTSTFQIARNYRHVCTPMPGPQSCLFWKGNSKFWKPIPEVSFLLNLGQTLIACLIPR
jgi:hypothetical protein